MTIQNLRSLLGLIRDSLDAIEGVAAAQGTDWPDLDNAALSPEAFKLLGNASVQEASTILVSAAHQLVASVQAPQTTLFHAGCSVSSLKPTTSEACPPFNHIVVPVLPFRCLAHGD